MDPERLAAIKPPQAAFTKASKKPKFSHTCARCGKVWDMPIQLDTSRPVYCSECLPIVKEERKGQGKDLRVAKREPLPPDRGGDRLGSSARSGDRGLARGGGGGRTSSAPPAQNRPRIVGTNAAPSASLGLSPRSVTSSPPPRRAEPERATFPAFGDDDDDSDDGENLSVVFKKSSSTPRPSAPHRPTSTPSKIDLGL